MNIYEYADYFNTTTLFYKRLYYKGHIPLHALSHRSSPNFHLLLPEPCIVLRRPHPLAPPPPGAGTASTSV